MIDLGYTCVGDERADRTGVSEVIYGAGKTAVQTVRGAGGRGHRVRGFRETSTLGIRRRIMDRTVPPRGLEVRDTAFGPISAKIAMLPDGTERATPEYEDCAAAARVAGVSLATVMDTALG